MMLDYTEAPLVSSRAFVIVMSVFNVEGVVIMAKNSATGQKWAQTPPTNSKEVEEEFKQQAHNYEEYITDWGYSTPQDSTDILNEFVPKDAHILEAGCGTGLPDQYHYDAGYKHLSGCDLSQEMLDIAKQKNIHHELKKADLSSSLPFETDQFDALTCLGTLTYIKDIEPTLKEFCRVTKSGGKVIFSHRNDLYEELDLAGLFAKLESEGLWHKISQSPWKLYLPDHEAYGDKIKVGYFVYQVK